MEMNTVYLALATCSSVALLIIGLAIPLYLGKIERNGFYGFRTNKTLSSDEIWYAANRNSAVNFIGAGLLILLTAFVLLLVRNRLEIDSLVIAIASITIVSLVGAVIKSFMFLSNYSENK